MRVVWGARLAYTCVGRRWCISGEVRWQGRSNVGAKASEGAAFIIGCGAVLAAISAMMLLNAGVHLRTSVKRTPEWSSGRHCSSKRCVGRASFGVSMGAPPLSDAGMVRRWLLICARLVRTHDEIFDL